MNKKDKINLIVSGILIILGIWLIVYPQLGDANPINLLYIVFGIYGVIKVIEYFVCKHQKDREDLYTGVVSIVYALTSIKYANSTSLVVLSITFATWTAIMSIIKLIKLDYYHDRQNRMLNINIMTFLLFLVIGILTSFNLYFEDTVKTLIIGYFFIINGILNMLEDTTRICLDINVPKKEEKKQPNKKIKKS